MKQKTLLITSIIAVIVAIVAYFIGNTNGYSRGQNECTQKLTRPTAYWHKVIELEKLYLVESFPAHLPQFQTGKYRTSDVKVWQKKLNLNTSKKRIFLQ